MDHQETVDQNALKKPIEIDYNCTKCPSPIEILSLDQSDSTIEFKCENNHQIKMPIKDYPDKMKPYSNNDINNDKCNKHENEIYVSYCLICKKHLCNKCLKERKHVGHMKTSIIEIQPNDEELNNLENIIKNNEGEITKLEAEMITKAKNIDIKLKEFKDILLEKKGTAIKDNKNYKEKGLELKEDKNIIDIDNAQKNKVNEILQIFGYDKKLEKLKNLQRLLEIIYHTYDSGKNNYYNSINIKNALDNCLRNNELNKEPKNVFVIKEKEENNININKEDENKKIEKMKNDYEEKIKNFEKKLQEKDDECNKLKNEYEKKNNNM